MRFVLGLSALLLAGAPALASSGTASPAGIDPKLATATPYYISLKIFDQCLYLQSRLNRTTQEAVHSPCSCYAKRTVQLMDPPELDFFRANAFLNETARAKALDSLDTCKLKRPS